MKATLLNRIFVFFAAAVFGLLAFGVGCDRGYPDDADDFAGTWALSASNSGSSNIVSYAIFDSDESYVISDDEDGAQVRLSGSFTVTDDGMLVGPFTNSSGEGRIEATIEHGDIKLNVIQAWYNPDKVVPYVGQKQ
jgi:hypothetical protein